MSGVFLFPHKHCCSFKGQILAVYGMGSFKNLSLFLSEVIFSRECGLCIGMNLILLIFVSLFTVNLVNEPSDKTLNPNFLSHAIFSLLGQNHQCFLCSTLL